MATRELALEALKQVFDPELLINIVDLGLVYRLEVDGGRVDVEMTLTSPACPAGPQIVRQSEMALRALDGVEQANVSLTMFPPWTPDRMSEEARDQMGVF